MFTAAYVAAIVGVGVSVNPIDRRWLVGIALLPGVAAFIGGIPKVVRSRTRGITALFHLVAYPLVAVITMGGPGVLLLLGIGETVGNWSRVIGWL